MGCSQQYVSLILKGKENLTLETISKLERVLDYEILSFPETHGNGYGLPTSRPYAYLNDAEAPAYGNSDTTVR